MSVRKKILFIIPAAVLLSCGTVAAAIINTDGEKGVVRTISAKTMGPGMLNFGTGINIFQSSDYVGDVYNVAKNDSITYSSANREDPKLLSSNIFFGMGLTRFWDIAMSLPFYYDWIGFDNLQDGGIGDMEISSKFLYPVLSKRLFYQSYLVSVTIPTGMRNSGYFPRHPYYIEGDTVNPATSYYSAEYPTVKGLMLWTFDIGSVVPKAPVQIHLNLGGVITTSTQHERNTAVGSLAIEYSPLEMLTAFVDFHGESRWSNFSTTLDPSTDPMMVSPGIRLTTPSGVFLNFIGDFSLSSHAKSARLNWDRTLSGTEYRYSTGVMPDYGVQFILGWNGYLVTPDADKDGIPDNIDKCPNVKEDFDNFQDDDGCPDPDNDNDGIPDTIDKCPNDPEDKDGFQDDDGCPDLDNDGDGIQDSKDQCPNLAEDFDGFEDYDGCPDIDNDKDGVPDSLDKCPNDPEDIDAFQDADGCPDLDNDQDGVPDLKDKCPNVPGLPQNDGCPPPDTVKPAQPVKREIDFPKQQIMYGIEFRKGTAELTFESYQYLDPIVLKLKMYPEVEIELHGHTDGMDGLEKSMALSQMRTETVRQYFIAKGIAPERIRAIGFGSSSPIADNKTATGRAKNRRIEMIRVK